MDVAPQGTANGHTVVLLHGNNFGGFYFKPVIDALTKEGFRVIVPDQIGYGIVEADCAVQLQLAGAKHLSDPAEGEDRTGDGGRPFDGWHAGGAPGDAVSEGGRAAGDLQPDRPHRRPLRSADDANRRVVSADAQERLPEHPGRAEPLRGSQPEGMECGVRDLHPDPLLVDAQRRLAEAGDGAGPDRPDALRRPCRLRLGAHSGADARVRRRRGHAARSGRAVPGTDAVPRQDRSPTATAACCCFPVSATSRISRRPTRCCRRWSRSSRRDWPRSRGSVESCSALQNRRAQHTWNEYPRGTCEPSVDLAMAQIVLV